MTLWYSVLNLSSHWLHLINSGSSKAPCVSIRGLWYYIERYNRTVRHEWLGCFIFDTIKEVQDHATRWLWTYNNDRPNMAIGGITPRQKLKMAA
jgi:hypothetical protein